jgi:hypothetical protein
MSYAQLLDDLNRGPQQGVFSFMRGRCVKPAVEVKAGDPIPEDCFLPEDREDEGRQQDPVFDNPPDNMEPMPSDLTGCEVIDFEDLRKKGGRVIGRHDAIVDLPWFFTAQFVSRRLQCTVAEAKALSDYWQALEFTEAMVSAAISEVKDVPAAIAQYQALADAVKALAIDPEDAMEHRPDCFAHNPVDVGSNEFNPEWLLLLNDGVPSAAHIAHRLGCSLAEAGDIRDALILQDFDDAKGLVEQHSIDEDEDKLDVEPTDEQDEDVRGFVSEGWHLMDDQDLTPDWLDLQPAQVRVLFRQVERAQSLAHLKTLGQKVYALSWTPAQRSVFWSLWRVRKAAILAQVVARQARVRKAIEKLRRLQGPMLAQAGQKLFVLSKSTPSFYSDEAWTAIWATYNAVKAQPKAKLAFDRKAAVAHWLKAHA